MRAKAGQLSVEQLIACLVAALDYNDWLCRMAMYMHIVQCSQFFITSRWPYRGRLFITYAPGMRGVKQDSRSYSFLAKCFKVHADGGGGVQILSIRGYIINGGTHIRDVEACLLKNVKSMTASV